MHEMSPTHLPRNPNNSNGKKNLRIHFWAIIYIDLNAKTQILESIMDGPLKKSQK